MTKKEMGKRYLLFIISLFFIGLGIALTKRSELGVSAFFTGMIAKWFRARLETSITAFLAN